MNERNIQQVLEIENQAQAIHDAAVKEAEQLPRQAEAQRQQMIDKAKADAEEEARQMIAQAQAQDEIKRILDQAEKDASRSEALSTTHLERAVAYVLHRVVGRE
jgi:vacuolar-type H+-ATPase subunit H